MNTLGVLEKLLIAGEITEDEYRERKAAYIETILELYIVGILTKEQMQEKLNEFAEYFKIPYRTVQNWEYGQRKCPDYLLDLMQYKLEKEKFGQKITPEGQTLSFKEMLR